MTIYVCDACERVVENKSDLNQIDMTFYKWQSKDGYWKYQDKWKPKDRSVEICDKCKDEFFNALNSFMKQRGKLHDKTKSDTGNGD